jgi:predicted NBD/HSP70 family sugar kinase
MDRPAGSAKLLRAINSSAALAHLLHRGQLTRAELRELTGLSKPTSSEMLRLLTEAGLAIVIGRTSGGPGPTAEIYAPNPDAAYSISISVRDTSGEERPPVAAALADLAGTMRARLEPDVATAAPVEMITRAVAGVCAAAGVARRRVGHIQIGIAGSYDPRTGSIHHFEVPGWSEPGLFREIAHRLGGTVTIDNDVNLAAVAERVRGVGRHAEGFALLWLGHGIGLATDLDSTLLRGARGGAGEIGYVPLHRPGTTAEPGAPQDLQDLIGGLAVLQLAREYGLTAATHDAAVRLAAHAPGAIDEAGRRFVAAFAERIAFALAAVVAVLDPPLVVLAGETAQAGGEPLRDAVAAALLRAAPLETDVAVTAVTDDAVLLGGLDAGLAALRESLITAIGQPGEDPFRLPGQARERTTKATRARDSGDQSVRSTLRNVRPDDRQSRRSDRAAHDPGPAGAGNPTARTPGHSPTPTDPTVSRPAPRSLTPRSTS